MTMKAIQGHQKWHNLINDIILSFTYYCRTVSTVNLAQFLRYYDFFNVPDCT